ncbi:hypothetical protein ACP70R_008785 [Stipagrostis hirtigluma subsp. patula]
MDAGHGSSSSSSSNRRTTTSGGGRGKEMWENAGSRPMRCYSLFPETSHRPLGGLFSVDQRATGPAHMPRLEDGPSSKVLIPGVQAQRHTQVKIDQTCLELLLGDEEYDVATVFPQGINPCCPNTMNLQDKKSKPATGLNIQGRMINHENIVPDHSGGSGSLVSTGHQLDSHVALLNKFGPRDPNRQSPSNFHSAAPRVNNMELFGPIMAAQKACTCGVHDPDQSTPLKLLVVNHYNPDFLTQDSGESAANAVVTSQHHGDTHENIHSYDSGLSRRSHHESQLTIQKERSPVNRSFRLADIKGKVPECCADQSGSRLIQQAIEGATKQEIIMVYEEIMPHACALSTDMFANHAVQKLLDYGPPLYRRKLISHLFGNVLPISLHMYGCRVIQKAFEVGDMDHKVVMAFELGGKVLMCCRDKNANHVIQKCIECVPPQRIQFIFRSFRGKVRSLSMHSCACRIVQRVLSYCDNPEIYHDLVAEIVESVTKLASDPFGNYIVQHVLEIGGPVERSTVVQKLAGRMVSMSYHKFASNVIEKCLSFGSYHDQQLIVNEILYAGGGVHFDHLLDMMTNPSANFVIQKIIACAEDWQLEMIMNVARSNMERLLSYSHGRHVVAYLERFLRERARKMMRLRNYQQLHGGHVSSGCGPQESKQR